MSIVACQICGARFEARTSRQKYCSRKCKDRGKPSASWQGGTRARNGEAGHGSPGAYKNGCRCIVCRDGHAQRYREYAARRSAEGRPLHKTKPTAPATCAGCGAAFMARRDKVRAGGGRFCSVDCHNRVQADGSARQAVRERHRAHGKQGSVRWRALRRARAALELTGGNRVFVQGACLVCGDQFTGVGAASRYCSDACKDKNKRGGFGIRFLDRMWLYSRDDFECHLCGTPVDMSADDLDPAAATLDHIVPQAHGGGHEPENLATAHRLCNSFRRDIPLAEFLTDETVQELRVRLGVSRVTSGCGRV